MSAKLAATAIMCTFLMVPCRLAQASHQEAETGFWYLLARRADRPEKNYYELTRTARFMENPFSSEEMVRQYKPSPRNYGADVFTDSTVRYGVYQAWKVRVIGTSDSKKMPTSLKDSTFVLSYSRNLDWRFAAKKYKVVRTTNGGQNVTYTDFQDGREYTMELSPDWPRPWTIYEVEIINSNALVEIWQATVDKSAQESASTHGRESIVNKRITAGASCHIDFEEGEIPNCLYQTDAGQLFIAPEFVKKLHFKSHGLAGVFSEKQGWMYINRKGKVVVQGVVSEDNGPAPFYDELVRVVRNKKYGFANHKGQLVISAIYDGAGDFVGGKAEVCKGCENKCADHDCEHHFFSGGEWFQIDTRGTFVRIQHDDSYAVFPLR